MTMFTRRTALSAALALPAAARAQSAAQGWSPDRPVRLIVGFAPGGSADIVARVAAQELARSLGQQVVVENRTGASGNLATLAVTAAPGDGLTLGFAGLQLVTNPALLPQLGYDPMQLQMVGQLTALPVLVMASTKSGITTLAQAIERSRRGEGLNIGTAGVGTSSHLGAELLFREVRGRFTAVPFRGGAPAFQALLSGDVDMMFDIAAGYQAPAAAEGKVRILGVMQQQRAAGLPDVPSFGEQGLGEAAQMRSWQGLFVRAGTPAAALAALHRASAAVAAAPDAAGRFRGMSMEPVASPSPDAFQLFYLSELQRWTTLIREAGITTQ
jgi:tripartite-type tricarboxylate transporter receptor subunit TctC